MATKIERLAEREGVGDVRVEVENASRRTTVPNAEAIGVGPTTRVVLWDTLLDGRFSDREIQVIAAHELGHVGRDHLWKGIAWFALFALPSAWLLAVLTTGVAAPPADRRPVRGLVVVALQPRCSGTNAVSRRYEAERTGSHWTRRATGRSRSLFRKFTTTALDHPSRRLGSSFPVDAPELVDRARWRGPGRLR